MTPTEPHLLIERARAMAPAVEAAATRSEASGLLDASVGSALLDAGLLHALVPLELGGSAVDIVTAIELFEEVARQDGSTGWSLMAAAASTAFAAMYASDTVAAELFGNGRRSVMAGQLSPRGRAVPTADGVGGAIVEIDVSGAIGPSGAGGLAPPGYEVSGSYQFGSGSDRATHMLGGCLVMADGAPVMRPSGMPEILAVIVPRDRVVFRGNWNVMGLAGTASIDYEITPTLIDRGAAFSIFADEPLRGGVTHRLGVMTITAAGHAGFALGVARRALDEIAALASTKTRMGDVRLGDQQAFQVGYARAEAKVRAARSFIVEAFVTAEAAVRTTGEQPLRARHLARLATTWGTEVCAEAVEWAYRESGSDGLRLPSVLGRCFRDIHAGTQHVFVSRKTLTDAAADLLVRG